MKQLSDADIQKMADDDFTPDVRAVNRAVRAELHLAKLIPTPSAPAPRHAVLDLHQHTEQCAWDEIMNLAQSGARTATIITGASGILHKKFPTWATESVLAPYIFSFSPINNGSFRVQFRRQSKKI